MAGDDKLYKITETTLIKTFTRITKDIIPQRCLDHAKKIEAVEGKVDKFDVSLSLLSNNVEKALKQLNNMNAQLFVTNGKKCLADKVNNNESSIELHKREHDKKEKEEEKDNSDKKWSIGTIISIAGILIAFISVLFVAYDMHNKVNAIKKMKEEILIEIKEETK